MWLKFGSILVAVSMVYDTFVVNGTTKLAVVELLSEPNHFNAVLVQFPFLYITKKFSFPLLNIVLIF